MSRYLSSCVSNVIVNDDRKKFICLHDADNVLVCVAPVKAGERIELENGSVFLTRDIDVGHKIARAPIERDNKIIKHGVSIGSALANISPGEHVHTHNMKSDYIRSHSRDIHSRP